MRPATTLGALPTVGIQTKLQVNKPNDAYEIEAGQVADQVMRMPAGDLSSWGRSAPTAPTLQLKCAACGSEEETAMRSAYGGAPEVTPAIERNIGRMQGGGKPLDDQSRTFFEQRMEADFSNVRIHTDTNAIQTSRDINARAFTVGNNIAFNSGEYNPNTAVGKHLLAHELTHTIQQGQQQRLGRYEIDTTQRTFLEEVEQHAPHLQAIIKRLLLQGISKEQISSFLTENLRVGLEIGKPPTDGSVQRSPSNTIARRQQSSNQDNWTRMLDQLFQVQFSDGTVLPGWCVALMLGHMAIIPGGLPAATLLGGGIALSNNYNVTIAFGGQLSGMIGGKGGGIGEGIVIAPGGIVSIFGFTAV